jgi:guanylate kinase
MIETGFFLIWKNYLFEQNYFSDTSRTKRADEVDSRDYHFISRLQFEQVRPTSTDLLQNIC